MVNCFLTGLSLKIFKPVFTCWPTENSSKAISLCFRHILPKKAQIFSDFELYIVYPRQLEGPNFEQLTVTDLVQLENELAATLTLIRARKVRFISIWSLKACSENHRDMGLTLNIKGHNAHYITKKMRHLSTFCLFPSWFTVKSDLSKRFQYNTVLLTCLMSLLFQYGQQDSEPQTTRHQQSLSILWLQFHPYWPQKKAYCFTLVLPL